MTISSVHWCEARVFDNFDIWRYRLRFAAAPASCISLLMICSNSSVQLSVCCIFPGKGCIGLDASASGRKGVRHVTPYSMAGRSYVELEALSSIGGDGHLSRN
jgi:hypothetical protein